MPCRRKAKPTKKRPVPAFPKRTVEPRKSKSDHARAGFNELVGLRLADRCSGTGLSSGCNESCLFCSARTIELATRVKAAAGKCVVHVQAGSENGVICPTCGGFACRLCLAAIIKKIPATQQANDRWCRAIAGYLDHGSVPNDFVGHCCEWQVLKDEVKNNERASRLDLGMSHRRYDGSFYVPEWGLLFGTELGAVDLMGIGPDSAAGLDAVWHAVVDELTSIDVHRAGVNPDASSARIVLSMSVAKEVFCPFSNTKFKVRSHRVLSQ